MREVLGLETAAEDRSRVCAVSFGLTARNDLALGRPSTLFPEAYALVTVPFPLHTAERFRCGGILYIDLGLCERVLNWCEDTADSQSLFPSLRETVATSGAVDDNAVAGANLTNLDSRGETIPCREHRCNRTSIRGRVAGGTGWGRMRRGSDREVKFGT